jgi:fructose-specific phosphotransferase system IIA component
MNIESVINTELIQLFLDSDSKIDALTQLIDLLHKTDRISDKDSFLREVLDREQIETTDLGFGIAIPHGRCSAVKKPSVAIGKLNNPVDWSDPTEGQEPVYGIFLMASSPDDKGASHMEIIAKIATLLIDDQFVAFFKENQSDMQLFNRIKTLLGEG